MDEDDIISELAINELADAYNHSVSDVEEAIRQSDFTKQVAERVVREQRISDVDRLFVCTKLVHLGEDPSNLSIGPDDHPQMY